MQSKIDDNNSTKAWKGGMELLSTNLTTMELTLKPVTETSLENSSIFESEIIPF